MNTLQDMFLNNTMNLEYFENLKKGSTLILHEKFNHHTILFAEPFEITIESTKTQDITAGYDSNEIEEALMITDVDGDTYLVEYAMLVPTINKYEVYPNWNVYYSLMQKEIEQKINKQQQLTKFVDDYNRFKADMYAENPENLI